MNILSPLQLKTFKENLKSKMDVAQAISQLISIHEKFVDKISDLDNLINKKVGPKGDRGPVGPIGPQGPEGKSLNVDTIIKFIQSRIRVPEDGKPGKDGFIPQKGIHFFTEEDKLHIAKLATALIKLPETKEIEIDPMKIIEAIEKLPPGKRLTSKHIDGLNQTISAISNQTKKGYLHGGGDTVTAGTGIMITKSSAGIKIISALNGGAFPQMTTVQRLALSAINGQTAYDTNLNVPMIYVNGYWGTVLLN